MSSIDDTLYIVGVPDTATEHQVREIYSKYGNVINATILSTRGEFQTHTVFVQFDNAESARIAKNETNCTNPFDPDGPLISVRIADKNRRGKRNDRDKNDYEKRPRQNYRDEHNRTREYERDREKMRERRDDERKQKERKIPYDPLRMEYHGYFNYIRLRDVTQQRQMNDGRNQRGDFNLPTQFNQSPRRDQMSSPGHPYSYN